MGALLSLPLLAVPSVGTVSAITMPSSFAAGHRHRLLTDGCYTDSIMRRNLLRCSNMLGPMQRLR